MADMSAGAESLSPRGVAAAAGLWLVPHVLQAIHYLDETSAPAASLVALAMVVAATAWVARPLLGHDPALSLGAAVGLGAVPVLASVVVCSVLASASLPGYGNWWPGAVGPLLAGLVMRGHRSVAVASAGLSCSAMVALVLARFEDAQRAPVVAVSLVVPPVLWTTAAIGVRWLLRRADDSVELYAAVRHDSVRRETEAGSAKRVRQERERRLREDVVPVLAAVANGDAGDQLLRARLGSLESSLRDDIRGRRLLDSGVRREVGRARADGVRVVLVDDHEGVLADADVELARRCVVAALRALRSGDLSARLPGGAGTLVTIVVQSGGAAAAAAAVTAEAGAGAVVDLVEDDLFVEVCREGDARGALAGTTERHE